MNDFNEKYPASGSPKDVDFGTYMEISSDRYTNVSILENLLQFSTVGMLGAVSGDEQEAALVGLNNNVNRIRLKCVEAFRSAHISSIALFLSAARQRL